MCWICRYWTDMHAQSYASFRRRSCSTSRRCARNYTSRRPFKAISPVTGRWVPWGLSSGREVRWFIHSSPDQRGHQQGVEGGQLDKADHHAETLLQAEMSPVADWYFTCDQLSALLLLFCCHCEQTKFFRCYCEQTLFSFATVSKLYCFFEVLLSFWKHFLFLRETLQILILLALLSYQLVWVKIRFFI